MGIHTSEAIEGSVAFHITPADAIRASGFYYFPRGDSTQNGSVVYNGEECGHCVSGDRSDHSAAEPAITVV